jgi:hypothetical protein
MSNRISLDELDTKFLQYYKAFVGDALGADVVRFHTGWLDLLRQQGWTLEEYDRASTAKFLEMFGDQ